MEIKTSVSVTLTEEETYQVLENYIRRKLVCEQGVDLLGYVVDDADSACRNGKGATFFFIEKEKKNV